jgi:hypothetical protein
MNLDLSVLNIFVAAAIGSALIPLVLTILNFKRQPPEIKWLAYILLLSFVCDLLSISLYKLFHFPVNFFGSIFTVLHIPVLSCFFYTVLKGRNLKIILIVVNVIYLFLSTSNFFFVQKLSLNTYTTIIEKLFVMTLSIMYFYRLLHDLPAARIYEIGLFWIISAMFITESAKLVLFSFVTYLITAYKDDLIVLWVIHNSMSVLYHLTIAWGVHLNNKSHRTVLAKA